MLLLRSDIPNCSNGGNKRAWHLLSHAPQVTTIADLRVNSEGVSRGDKLEVRMGTKLTRVDRILTVYETLWKDDGTLVAHAEIALMCIANETRKFRPVPSWVQDILAVPSTAPVS